MEITVPPDLLSEGYFTFLLRRPLPEIWSLFLLTLARVIPPIAIVPFLGGKILPDPAKVGFGIAVALLFLPFLSVQVTAPLTLSIPYFLLVCKEIIIGSVIGLFATIPFLVAQGAGELIDHQRGSQSLQVMDPATQTQTSPIGTFNNNVTIVLFFMAGGPILFFQAFANSYNLLPVDQFFPATFFKYDHHFWSAVIGMITKIVTIILQLSAPALIAMLMSDLFIGIANRMAPQVQISFLLWSLKAYVGIALLWVGWWLIFKQLEVESLSWIKYVSQLIHFMHT